MCLGIPGKIIEITGSDPLTKIAKVQFGGIEKEVYLTYVPEANVGDYVVVHVGFAISRINEAEANRVFKTLKEMDIMDVETQVKKE